MNDTPPPPSSPLRIAVLEADHPLDGTKEKYGTYGAVFTSLLQAAAASLSWPSSALETTKYDVERLQQFPPSLDDLDAILITGSRANAFDNTPWIVQLTDYVHDVLTAQQRVKVVGVCFGHQIVARAMGAKVERGAAGWEASVMTVSLTGKGKELFGLENMRIFQMHRDIVTALPAGAELLGTTEKCEIQGMYSPAKFITVQGHPEFTEEIVREILVMRHGMGIFTDEEFKDMIGRVGDVQDGVKIASGFLKFVVAG